MRGTIGATMILLAGYSFAPLAAQDDPPALAEYEAPDFSSVTGEEDVAMLVESGDLVVKVDNGLDPETAAEIADFSGLQRVHN